MNNRLTLQDIAALLAERTGKDKQQTELFLKEFVAQIREGVYSDKIAKVKGVGTFKIILVDQRESVHVNTGERFLIPAHYKFSFLPDKELRDLVNKPFSFFETTELGENVRFSDLEESEETEDKEADPEDESVVEVMPDEVLPTSDGAGQTPDAPQELALESAATALAETALPQLETAPETTPQAEPLIWPEELGEQDRPAEVLSETKAESETEQQSELESGDEPEEEIRPEEEIEGIIEPESLSEPEETDAPEETEPSVLTSPFSVGEQDTSPEEQENRNKRAAADFRKKVVLAFALLMCCIGAAYLYVNRTFIRNLLFGVEVVYPSSDTPTAGESIPVSPAEPPVVSDTLAVDTAAVTPAPATKEKTAPKILATVKIEPGSRLTLISLEYYGSKLFWVYLYEYNKARISDPNNIPVGTLIEVPAPELYGIDAHDKASIAKAAARQTEILSGGD